jgi:hypothetical protein
MAKSRSRFPAKGRAHLALMTISIIDNQNA